MSNLSVQVLCKCKKRKGWVADGEVSEPCPYCGRRYKGKYNPKTLNIDAIEIKLT